LLLIEREKRVRSDFDGYGNVEKVHPADGNGETVFGTEFARGADGVPPIELGMRPVTKTDFLLEQANLIARVSGVDGADTLQLTKRVEDFNAMPRGPNNFRLRMVVEQSDRDEVVRVPARFVGEPPRSIRVNGHFLSVRRNATPSNFGLVGSPTARASASSRVMRGRGFSAVLRFGLRGAVFIGVGWCCV
jgi:hypothetical protein